MARISKLRGSGSFRRRPGQKPPRSITLIVCEGETEQEYFDAARIHYELTNAEVIIADNTVGSAPISVVECAGGGAKSQVAMTRFAVSSTVMVIQVLIAREKIRIWPTGKGIRFPSRKSSPYRASKYVLLHFERSDAPFGSCDEVIRRIRDRHMAGYEKARRYGCRYLMANGGCANNADCLNRVRRTTITTPIPQFTGYFSILNR